MASIDPIRLAQFMVLPGAAELVEAFANLPPGEIRDSVVSHAQVLAKAHAGWTPPFEMARVVTPEAPPRPPRLQSPFAEDLKSKSAEGQIVERALKGELLHNIADDLGVPLGTVSRLIAKARREGGVVFPGDDKPKPKKPLAKVRKKFAGMPIPPPPYWWENPESPIWDNPKLLPALAARPDGTEAGFGPNDARGFKIMTEAAHQRGLTLRQYIAQRYEMVRRVEAGESVTAVGLEMGINPNGIYLLLAKIGRSRMAMALKREAELPPEPSAPQISDREAARLALAHHSRAMAAAKWGFPTVDSWEHARMRVRDLRMEGFTPMVISRRLEQSRGFVKAALDYWREQGVRWPVSLRGQQSPPAAA